MHHPQGVALGYELLPLQGEALNTEMRRHGGMETRRYGDTKVWRYGGKCYVFEDTESFLELRDSVLILNNYLCHVVGEMLMANGGYVKSFGVDEKS